jgi:PPOX class probable F420-dependent enzyme
MLSERARALLQEPLVGVLATINVNGTIQQTNMWYLPIGDTILLNTTIERVKYRNLKRNPHASLRIGDAYQYVTISGDIQIIDDPIGGSQDIHRLALRYYSAERAMQEMQVFRKQTRVTLLLHPQHVIEYFSQ